MFFEITKISLYSSLLNKLYNFEKFNKKFIPNLSK